MVDRLDASPLDRLDHVGIRVAAEAVGSIGALVQRLDLSDLDLMTMRDLLRQAPDPTDPGLITLLALMFAALDAGSLCLPLERPDLPAYPTANGDTQSDFLIDAMRDGMARGTYTHLIGEAGHADFKPLILDSSTGRPLLYFQRFHHHEKRLKQHLACFLERSGTDIPDAARLHTIIDRIYDRRRIIRHGADKRPMIRDPYQEQAIRSALSIPLLIVSGGPGTGKTSLLANILRAQVRCGVDPGRIRLAAPTGRAAQRMGEALTASLASIAEPDAEDRSLDRLKGSTLHKLLGYSHRSGGFTYHRDRPLNADLLAVDEVSMVDVVMMDRLFQAVDPARTRVILMGDKDQLPSVDAGSVLADLSLPDNTPWRSNLVILHNVYRSGGRLLELARKINAGQSIPLRPTAFASALSIPSGEWAFVDMAKGPVPEAIIDDWTRHHYVQASGEDAAGYRDDIMALTQRSGSSRSSSHPAVSDLLDRLFNAAYRRRILTVVRHGPRGAHDINARIAQRLRPILDPAARPDNRLFNGALIMITRNDYARGLFNGDIGIVLRHGGDGAYQAFFRQADRVATFPARGLPDWELAFAMTVHKSQGSEFEDTCLVLPDDSQHRLLTREVLYTAITRASRRLIVCGTVPVFEAALGRTIHRTSGMMMPSPAKAD